MELPERTQPLPAEIVAVREVRIPVPPEKEAAVREFYASVFYLNEWPEPHRPLGGFGAGRPRRGIFFIHDHNPQVDPNRPRLHLLVPSLSELAARLDEREWPYSLWHGIGLNGDTLHVADPVGHLIEVRQSCPI
jgi:hypothetical protein